MTFDPSSGGSGIRLNAHSEMLICAISTKTEIKICTNDVYGAK